MKFRYIKDNYIKEVQQKFKNNYKIDLGPNSSNKYIVLKYMYNNYLGAIFAFGAIKSNLSANFITYTNIVLAIIGFLVFLLNLENFKYVALLIFFSKNILDNVDGFVARFKKETSEFGDKLDFYSALFYYFAVLASLALNNFYLTNHYTILIIVLIIFILDFLNPIKFFENKTKIIESKKKIYSNTLYKIFRFSNYDGRTSITDLIIFIFIIEISLEVSFLSTIIILFFLSFKVIRNFYYIYKKLMSE